MCMMEKPVDGGSGNSFLCQDLRPTTKSLIRSENHTAIFVTGIDHLEEEVRFFFREILVTDFIDEDQMRFSQPCQSAFQTPLFTCPFKPFDQIYTTGVPDSELGHARFVSQGQHEVALALMENFP